MRRPNLNITLAIILIALQNISKLGATIGAQQQYSWRLYFNVYSLYEILTYYFLLVSTFGVPDCFYAHLYFYYKYYYYCAVYDACKCSITFRPEWSICFVCTLHYLIIIIMQTGLKALSTWNGCQIYCVKCKSQIKSIISIILCSKWVVRFQLTHLCCDGYENKSTWCYCHHQINMQFLNCHYENSWCYWRMCN